MTTIDTATNAKPPPHDTPPSAAMPLLAVRNLTKRFDTTVAVDAIDFDVNAGEIVGLLGPNGAGKTTTMMMLAGLLTPDDGAITIKGQSFATGGRSLRKAIGLVPQDLAVYDTLSPIENMTVFGGLYGLSDATLSHRIADVLDIVGLTSVARKRVATFSGGMKRRLNFGIAILHNPALLILDEPTVGVDPQSRSYLLAQVETLSRAGTGIIFASHHIEEVQAVSHRVAVMDHGRIIANDTLEVLLERVSGTVELRVAGLSDHLAQRINSLVDITHAQNGAATIRLTAADQQVAGYPVAALAKLLAMLDDGGVTVRSISAAESDLESLFLQLTGHELRD